MKLARIIVILALAAVYLTTYTACDKLALEGPKKYKVDLMNILQDVKDGIRIDGDVPDRLIEKFDKFLVKHEPEYGEKGSHIRSMEILKSLRESQTDEETKFRTYQFVTAQVEAVILTLQTEIPD